MADIHDEHCDRIILPLPQHAARKAEILGTARFGAKRRAIQPNHVEALAAGLTIDGNARLAAGSREVSLVESSS